MLFYRTRRARHALTIIEVMIAIGVILIGLLGVAALIPIAAEDASASVRMDSGVRMAASVTADLRARDIGSFSNVYYWDNDLRNDDGRGVNAQPARKSPVADLDAPSFEQQASYRTGRMAAFCIDPGFLSVAQAPSDLQTLPINRNAYQLSRFPYYNEFYDGLSPPNALLGSLNSGYPSPRMWRIGFGAPPSSAARPFYPPGVTNLLIRGEHELVMDRSDDKLAPLGQLINPLSGDVVGSRQYEARYSWIATVAPVDGSDLYKLSVVVIENRARSSGITPAAMSPYQATTSRDNLPSERLAWIANGVSLGSNSEVEIYASELVSSDVKSGQWVMLSNQPYINGQPHPTIPAIHRWFRVVQTGPVETGEFAVPQLGSVDNVWRRSVVLDGPNWSYEGNGNDGTIRNDTYMTIVEGAVAVIESDIRIH